MATTNTILAVITALTAVAAIIISSIQIYKNNKQSLFAKRLKIYIIVNDLLNLCKSHRSICEQYVDNLTIGPVIDLETLFYWMTNNQFLEQCQRLIQNILKDDEQNVFMHKLAELNSISEEAKLIFPKSTNEDLSCFIYGYQEMLLKMYQYIILINGKYDSEKKQGCFIPTDNKIENRERSKLLQLIKEVLNSSDYISKNKINKILKQIKY